MLCFRTTSHGFNTDVNWRCDNQEHVGWFADWFDDSSWSNALVVGNHPTYNSQYLAQNFDINAKLIWFYDTSFTGEVFCRARMYYGNGFSSILCVNYINVLVLCFQMELSCTSWLEQLCSFLKDVISTLTT